MIFDQVEVPDMSLQIEDSTWAERVQAVRYQLRLSQRELGLRINVSQGAIGACELGIRRPYSAAVERFIEFEKEVLAGKVKPDVRRAGNW